MIKTITLLLFILLFPSVAMGSSSSNPALSLGEKVADWQLQQLGYLPGLSVLPQPKSKSTAWELAAFWVGLARFAEQSALPKYKSALFKQGENNQWKLGSWLEFADDHAIGQSYLWAYRHGADSSVLTHMRESFDKILAKPPKVHLSFYFGKEGYASAECLVRWCWCDALFMSPQAMIELSSATGDPRYAEYAFSEFWATTDFLYDPAEKLYFRDSRFFALRDEKQRKLFWSRGNGWVFAGIANILNLLPEKHPQRPRFEALFKEMAARLLTLQKPDGFWAPSLLAPEGSPQESSGTAFFTYGLAFGLNHNILAGKVYQQAANKGWRALQTVVADNGRFGWVQQVSDRPESVKEDDTHYYGVGAFLLAASEMAQMHKKLK